MKRILLFFVFSLLSQFVFGQDYSSEIKELDAYIENSRQDWKIPGIAVAVVKDGKLLLSKGYGERKLGSGKLVDTKTIYNIGSTSKAFTAAAMGILVDEGKLNWDDKVSDYMPEFQLKDAYVSKDMRVRDLLTHNLGLPNADYLWANTDMRPAEILHRMRYLKPAYPLRAGYTYQNIMYLAAGELIAKVSGVSWADFITDRIFQPLGMKNSYATKARSQVEKNRSIAHHYRYGTSEIIPIEDFNADSIAAAGAIWSNIEDMSLWVKCMLDTARYEGGQLLKAGTWAELFKPHALIPQSQFYPTTQLTQPKWTSYSLGWFQHDYQGKALDFHTGSLPGTMAMIGLMHEEGIGYYFLGNLDHAELRHALMYKVFDTFLGNEGDGRDWSKAMLDLYDPVSRRNLSPKKKKAKKFSPKLELNKYEGSYSSQIWGEIKVWIEEGELWMQTQGRSPRKLVPRGENSFHIMPIEAWQGPQPLDFVLYEEESVIALSLGFYSFIRKEN